MPPTTRTPGIVQIPRPTTSFPGLVRRPQIHAKHRLDGDLHVVGYRDGERDGATFDAVLATLRRRDGDAVVVGGAVELQIGGDALALDLTVNRDTIEAITVHDAPLGTAFRHLLFDLLRCGPYLLFRGDLGRLVHAGRLQPHDVPAEILDGLGPLVVVADADALAGHLADAA
jgi:hypothetical protein